MTVLTVLAVLVAMACFAIWGRANGGPPETEDLDAFLAEAPGRLANFCLACIAFVLLLVIVAIL